MTDIPQMPANDEVEKEILGIMLNYPHVVPHVKKKLTAGMFYLTENQRIFRGLLSLYNTQGTKLDAVMLTETVDKMYGSEASYIIPDILHKGISDDRIDWYMENVTEYAARRKLIKMSGTMRKNANDLSVDINEIILSLDSGINLIRNAVTEDVDLTEDIEDMSIHIGNKDATIPFGIDILDRKIAGFMRNDITTLGGRTSHGKTTFAIDTIKHQLDLGYKINIVTNEVTKRLYLQKLACNIANIEYQKIIKFGDISDEEREKFAKAKQHMLKNYVSKLHIYEFVDNINSITSIISANKPDVFWLDWLQRIPLVPGVVDSKDWIKIVYGDLAKTSAKSNTACVVVSQLSTRKAQSRGNKRPELFDFDDSSFIEKASCDCHLLYWYYNDTLISEYMSVAELINAKNRFGEPSYCFLSHNAKSGRYSDSTMIPREKLQGYLKETGLDRNATS